MNPSATLETLEKVLRIIYPLTKLTDHFPITRNLE